MKKLTLILVSLILTMAMCGSAFALDTQQEGTGESGTAITSLLVPKDIVLFNTTTQDIYEPNITYTYTLETQNPGTGTIITDKNSVTGTVKTGVAGLVTIQGANGSGATGTAGTAASLVFGDDTSAGSDTNTEGASVTSSSKVATRNITVAFNTNVLKTGDPLAYPADAAGIYRFKITDTTTAAALTAAGIERDSSYDPVRYLDVYVFVVHLESSFSRRLETAVHYVYPEIVSVNDVLSQWKGAKVVVFDIIQRLVEIRVLFKCFHNN